MIINIKIITITIIIVRLSDKKYKILYAILLHKFFEHIYKRKSFDYNEIEKRLGGAI